MKESQIKAYNKQIEENIQSAMDWQALQDELHDWTVEKFGNPTNPIPSLNHLREELEELIADHQSAEEWADCFIILIHAAKKAGLDMTQIYSFITDKHFINKSRQWSEPDENGVCHHIK
jgi:predicted house-cleaning noncanonical NTP pyrophosphatase (MazG superfamily)